VSDISSAVTSPCLVAMTEAVGDLHTHTWHRYTAPGILGPQPCRYVMLTGSCAQASTCDNAVGSLSRASIDTHGLAHTVPAHLLRLSPVWVCDEEGGLGS
jgi:hypothetical protein